MTLTDWLEGERLRRHRPTRNEIGNLLKLTVRDLKSCRAKGLSADWRLGIAYNAALQAATAALSASGFRTRGGPHHYTTIQSLTHTMGADPGLLRLLHDFRKKRNTIAYKLAGTTTDAEAEEMIALAERLRKDVIAWLREKHPRLLQK